MTNELTDNPTGDPPGQPHRRRKRYAGKYPRRPDQRYKELAPDQFPDIHQHVRAQGRTPVGTHVPVMMAEVLEALRPKAGETAADCTVGYGGHAAELLKRLGPTGRLMGLDVDEVALQRSRERLLPEPPAGAAGCPGEPTVPDTPTTRTPSALRLNVVLKRSNFAGIARALADEGWNECDIILADLGLSSMQIDDPARGFSYKFDGPLDMRMDSRLPQSAADLLRSLPETKLAAALEELGDETAGAAIARAIVEARPHRLITRTQELVEFIFEVKGLTYRRWRQQSASGGEDLHPAARTFQALRILVNDELSALGQFLRTAPGCLRPGGRLAIITFHSGEDRLVKHAFREGEHQGTYSSISDEVIRPGPKERADNPRSASAKLRWAVRASQDSAKTGP
jgi:16S rRNA (cytosine1402-N4)-methyltransferase